MAKIGDIRTTPGTGTLYTDGTQDNVSATGNTPAQERTVAGVQTVTGDNLGNGEGLFAGSNGVRNILLEFRSLKAGSGISLQGDAQHLVITSTGTATTDLALMNGLLDVAHGGTGAITHAVNALLLGNGSAPIQSLAAPTEGNKYLTFIEGGYIWNDIPDVEEGGVTSVGLTAGSNKVTVSGSPITTSGNLTVDVVEANLGLNNLGGTLNVSKGGTGLATIPSNRLLLGNGTAQLQSLSLPTIANSVLGWDGTNYAWQTQQSGVTSVNATGSNGITVSGGPITGNGSLAISLSTTGVTAGQYSYPTMSVDAQGRVLSISTNAIPTVTGTNLVGGVSAFAGKVNDSLTFRQFVGANGVTVNQTADTVTLSLGTVAQAQGGTGSTSYTAGALLLSDGTKFVSAPAAPTSGTNVLAFNGTNYAWQSAAGQTAVAATNGSGLTVTTGTSGGVTTYTVGLDASQLNLNNLGNTLSVTKGGTGATSLPLNKLLVGNGTGAVKVVPEPTVVAAEYFLSYDGTSMEWVEAAPPTGIQSITAGQGLTITEDSSTEGGVITSNGSLHLTDTEATPGTYQVLGGQVDAKGRLLSTLDSTSYVLSRTNHTGTMSLASLVPGSAAPSTTAYDFNAPIEATTGTFTTINADDINVPTLASVAKSGNYADLNNKPTLFSGDYADLTNVPASEPVDYQDVLNTPVLADVATSGDYNDLSNTPNPYNLPAASATILGGVKVGFGLEIDEGVLSVAESSGLGTVTSVDVESSDDTITVVGGPISSSGTFDLVVNQENLNLSNITGVLSITRVPDAAVVAVSGQYADLMGKPSIPSIAGLATEIYVDLAIEAIPAGFSGDYDDLTNKPAPYVMPIATDTTLGGVIAGGGIAIDEDGVISIEAGAGLGTVTSVGLVSNTVAIVVGGAPSPIEGAGTYTLTLNSSAIDYETLGNLPTIPSIAGLATETYVDDAIAAIPEGFDGDYNSLTNKPTIPSIAGLATEDYVTQAIGDIPFPILAQVANTGSYNDLIDKPTIPSTVGLASQTYVNNAIQGAVEALPAPFSGDYFDLTNTPTIPSLAGYATESWVNDQFNNLPTPFSGSYTDLINKPNFQPVATTGNYADLTNKPTIPSLDGYATEAFVTDAIADVNGFSGDYNDLTNTPVLFSGSYTDLSNTPNISTVGTSGEYADLLNAPAIPSIAGLATETFVTTSIQDAIDEVNGFSGDYNDLDNLPTLFSGDYADLTGKPSLFDGQYSSLTGAPALATVATTGSYTDLLNQPTIPSITGLATESYVDAAIGALPAPFSGSYTDLSNTPNISTVGTSGEYADLLNKPTLFSGDYDDLTNKPSIPAAYTDSDARDAISISAGSSGVTYNSSTGVMDFTGLATGGGSGAPAGSSAAGTYRFSWVQNPGNTMTNGTTEAAVGMTGLPSGWSVSVAGGICTITHTVGRFPASINFLIGTGSTTAPVYRLVSGGVAGATGNVQLPTTGTTAPDLTKFTFTMGSAVGSIANGTCYAMVTF